MKTFRLSVVAPAHPQIDVDVQMVSVPAETGFLGVLAGHMPLLTMLKVGLFHYLTVEGKTRWYSVTGGFFEMLGSHATLLADDLVDLKEAEDSDLSYAGKPLILPAEYASDVQKYEIAREILRRKLVAIGKLKKADSRASASTQIPPESTSAH